jgi:amino acid permease
MILVFNVCALLAYLIIATDFILSWLRLADIDMTERWKRAGVVAAYAVLLPIALSIPKNLNFQAYVSSVTCLLIVFYVTSIVYEMASAISTQGFDPTGTWIKIDMHIFASIAVHTLAFALPTCVCPIVCDSDSDVKVRNKACFWALLIALVLCVIPAVSSYLQFGDNIEGNMLNTYPDDDKLMIAVRIGFFLCLTFSYPATHPPVICTWSVLIFKKNNAIDLTGWQRVTALIITNAIPLLVAMFLPDMKPALEIGGAIGGCLGSFSFPAVLWVIHSDKPKKHWTNVLSIIFAVWGGITAILATYYAVIDAIHAFKQE